MSQTIAPPDTDRATWPDIPAVAWQRPMGLPCPEAGHPRVHQPMTDDGTFAGIPIGGLGTGSIGRTHRGDAARWHLEVGRHAYVPVAADSFSVFVGRPGEPGQATVLSTLRPEALPDWGWTPARGRRHVPRPVPAGLAGVRTGRARDPPGRRAAEPRHRRRPDARAPCRSGSSSGGSRTRATEPLTVGLMLTWQDPARPIRLARRPAGAWHETAATPDVEGAILHAPIDAPTGLRGTFALAASRGPGVTVTVRSRFDAARRPRAVGRLRGRRPPRPVRRPPARARPARPSARPWRRPSNWPRASGVRSGSRSPGTCRWSSSGRAVGGGSATRATGAGPASARSTSPRHALTEAPTWRAAIEDWQRPVLDVARPARLVQGGPLQRAVLPGRRRELLGGRRGRSDRPRTGAIPAGSPCSSARTTRSTTASTWTSTRRSRSCGCSRSWSPAGSATCSHRSIGGRPGDRDDRGIRPAGPAQGGWDRAARRRRPGRRPVLPSQLVQVPGRQRLEGPGPKVVLQVWRDAVAAADDRRW